MASIATAIQYTIRSNLSVTIVAMVNNTNLVDHQIGEDNTNVFLLNRTTESKFIGCPIPMKYLNNKITSHELKVIDLFIIYCY